MLSLIFKTLAAVAIGSADNAFSTCEAGTCDEELSVQLLQQEVSVSNIAFAPAHTYAHAHAHARVHARAHTTTTTPDPTGVTLNAVGDLKAFVAALIANSIMIVVFVIAFSVLRLRYPLIYYNNVKAGFAPKMEGRYPPETLFGWVRFALYTRVDHMVDSIGLDNALLIGFSQFCMQVMAIIGIPMIVVGVLNWNFGGNAKCSKELGGCDNLSSFSFGNVLTNEQALERGVRTPWLYWLHAFVVWGVVFTVQINVYKAQEKFLQMRYNWLHKLPKKRANTIMVEGITKKWRSDERLKQFFTINIKDSEVVRAYVVRDTTKLAPLVAQRDAAYAGLKKAEAQKNKSDTKKNPMIRMSFCGPKVDAIEYYKTEIAIMETEIERERAEIASKAKDPEAEVSLQIGFVEFADRYHAEVARSLNYTQDNEQWCTSDPPVASDILWADLTQDVDAQFWRTVIGYLLTVGLFFAYLPLVIYITGIATRINMGPLQPIWQGLAPTMGLQVMVAMLPTFLVLIFSHFFTLKAEAFAQMRLQNWYYVFQVFFVILATSVGQNVTSFLNTLATDPFATFSVLADTMPYATHFYMNFLVLQWVSHFMNLLRYMQLGKYKAALAIFDEEDARRIAEPEDQDYYGIGSRSARWAINMNVGIVFGTLSPPICFLTFMNFFVCRLVYGYLIPFAETKKADLGGQFWVRKMKQMFYGNIIYCILMTGVFAQRADTWGPAAIAAPSIFYVLWSLNRFDTMFAWEKLPNMQLVHVNPLTGEKLKPHEYKDEDNTGEYVQPELVN